MRILLQSFALSVIYVVSSSTLTSNANASINAPLLWRLYGAVDDADDFVVIDAVSATSGHELLRELNGEGLRDGAARGRMVSGRLPRAAIDRLPDLTSLHDIRPGRLAYKSGVVTSEGDRALRADMARDLTGATGAGVTVGVISDSYNCLGGAAADKASGDLPANARALVDATDCDDARDEGRALMQIIHDLAPAAELVFHSGGIGIVGIANAVTSLANEPGIDIIVDDASSPSSSFFQHDVLAQAARQAVNQGIVHVTAAGNNGRNSYESAFRAHPNPLFDVASHDFDPGPGIDSMQAFELEEGASVSLIMQWDSPAFSISGAPGATSDLDLHVLDESGTTLIETGDSLNIGRDPIEVVFLVNPTDSGRTRFQLMITHQGGELPSVIKYIVNGRFPGGILEHATMSSTIVGHANVAESISVGVADYRKTPAFGVSPPQLRSFSPAGGLAILFDEQGRRFIDPIAPEKPDLIGVDGVETTFFGAPDEQDEDQSANDLDSDGFFEFNGSSAAAPHIAAVAALILEVRPELSPADVRAVLVESATNIPPRTDNMTEDPNTGFDVDSGYGLANVQAALSLAANRIPTRTGSLSPLQEPTTNDVPAMTNTISVGAGTTSLPLLFFLCVSFNQRAFPRRFVNVLSGGKSGAGYLRKRYSLSVRLRTNRLSGVAQKATSSSLSTKGEINSEQDQHIPCSLRRLDRIRYGSS